MSSPSQNELLDYIKTAIEIETDLATQEQIMNQCCLDIQHRKPSLQQDALPSMPQVEDTSTQWTGAGYVGIGGGIFIFLILLISVGSYDGGIWVSLLLLAFFAIPGILCIQYGKKREAKVEQQMQAYFEQTQQIQDRNQEKKNTYNSAIRQCNESEEAIRAAIQPGITETKALLEKLYDKNIIYRIDTPFHLHNVPYPLILSCQCAILSSVIHITNRRCGIAWYYTVVLTRSHRI